MKKNIQLQLLLISNDQVYIEQLKKIFKVFNVSIDILVFNKISAVIPYLDESNYLKLIIIKLDKNYNVNEIEKFAELKNSIFNQRILLYQKEYRKHVKLLNVETSNYLQEYSLFFKNKNVINFFKFDSQFLD